MKKNILLLAFLLSLTFLLMGCDRISNEVDRIETGLVENPNAKTDFIYSKASDFYSPDIVKKAIKDGNITEEDSIILHKYIGTDTSVRVPSYIDGHPVEIIDNYCFSPLRQGDENNVSLWTKILKSNNLSLKGNKSTQSLVPTYAGYAFNAFLDACVSTDYIEDKQKYGKTYDPKQHYKYYDKDYEKAINFLYNHEKFSNIKDVLLPNTIRAIGGCAFMFCDSMESIRCLATNVSVNDYCFAFCTSLKEAKLNITADTDYAFIGCVNLEKAWNYGHHIGTMMYACCPKLSFVSNARNIKYAKEKAFYRCESLKECHFPVLFMISPKFVDFNTFTAILNDKYACYKEFKEMDYPFTYRR